MSNWKIDRDLHRIIVHTLMDGVPRTLNELEAITGYNRRDIQKHMKNNMNIVERFRPRRPGEGGGGRFKTFTLPPAVLKLKPPPQFAAPPEDANPVEATVVEDDAPDMSHPDIL